MTNTNIIDQRGKKNLKTKELKTSTLILLNIYCILHDITCKQLRRCSPIIMLFSTQKALEQAKRTSLLPLNFLNLCQAKTDYRDRKKAV